MKKLKKHKFIAVGLTILFVLAPIVIPSVLSTFYLGLSDLILSVVPDAIAEKVRALGYSFDRYWMSEKVALLFTLLLNVFVLLLYYSSKALKYVLYALATVFIVLIIVSIMFKLSTVFYVPYTFVYKIYALISAPFAPLVLIPVINYMLKMNKEKEVL